MTSRKITPLLLAASVFLTGATGVFIGAMTPTYGLTSVDELSDVNKNHWAFEALRDLVEKYDVIEGYPDHTFRGNRMPTRWEMAAALNALAKSLGRDMARLGAEKASKADLETLARLQEEFRNELAALNTRVRALEGRASAIEAKNAEQDNRLSLLEKTQIHGDATFGFLSDIGASNVPQSASGNNPDDGFMDGMSAIGRLRLSMDIPLREDQDDSVFGEGRLYTRIISAFGRVGPNHASENGNTGLISPFNGYSRIAGDASVGNEGILAGAFPTGGQQLTVRRGTLRPNLYMESMYYSQHIKTGIPYLTDWMKSDEPGWEQSSDVRMGVIPWRHLYDKSPYRGDENNQFQNFLFVNTPVAVNYNMPMVAYEFHQGLGEDFSLDVVTGMGALNVGDVYDGMNLTYEARLNYNTGAFLGTDWNKPGSLYAGGFHAFLGGNTFNNVVTFPAATTQNGVTTPDFGIGSALSGLYLGWNQEWYEGIGTTINYSLANRSSSNFLFTSLNTGTGANVALNGPGAGISVAPQQTISGVLSIPMSAVAPGWRDNDVLGLGYGIVQLHKIGNELGNAFKRANEQVFEAYYKYQFNDSITFTPSVQLIINRLGMEQNDIATVIGFRTSYEF